MKRLLLGLFCFGIINSFSIVQAEVPFSLDGAVEYALKNNEALKAASFSLDAEKQEIGIAKSTFSPVVSLEERAMRTNNPGYALSIKMNQHRFSALDLSGAPDTFNSPGTLNDYQTAITFEQLLISHQADLGIAMAQKSFAAKRADYEQKKQEIVINVVQSYLSVQTATQFKVVSEKTIADAQEHLRVAEARYTAGVGLYSDVLRAKTAVTDAQQRLISSEKNVNVAKRQLGLVIGIDGPAEINSVLPFEESVKPIEYYYSAALNRSDIVALNLQTENAGTNVKFAQAGHLPVLAISGTYQMNDANTLLGSEGDSWLVTALFKWNVFDGNKTASEVNKAKLKQMEMATGLAGLRKTVQFKVYDDYLAVEEAVKNVELAKDSLASAEEGKRLIELRYTSSLAPIVDLLDAQLNLDNARVSLVARENDYRYAVARLEFESGIILKANEKAGEVKAQ
ncbi:MAG: outer membrane protein TolC [Firmicutes bacterium]|nr:outer membrane protein TolC [Bacillota bacterium]